jgi:hypothetical protein
MIVLPLLMAWSGAPVVGQLPPTLEASAFTGGVVLMILGLYLRLRLQEFQMTTEERAKDGRLTESQARWRIELMRMSGPVVVLIGLALFLALFFG